MFSKWAERYLQADPCRPAATAQPQCPPGSKQRRPQERHAKPMLRPRSAQ